MEALAKAEGRSQHSHPLAIACAGGEREATVGALEAKVILEYLRIPDRAARECRRCPRRGRRRRGGLKMYPRA
jgi:hypothetical protein